MTGILNGSTITTMNKQPTTIKVWRITRRLAKVLAASLDVSLVELLHRLVLDEIERKGLTIDSPN